MMMKSSIAAFAVMLAGLIGSAPEAEAGLEVSINFGQPYVSDYARCGCPIYSRREIRGYDCYHQPVYVVHREPFHCGCRYAHADRPAPRYDHVTPGYYRQEWKHHKILGKFHEKHLRKRFKKH